MVERAEGLVEAAELAVGEVVELVAAPVVEGELGRTQDRAVPGHSLLQLAGETGREVVVGVVVAGVALKHDFLAVADPDWGNRRAFDSKKFLSDWDHRVIYFLRQLGLAHLDSFFSFYSFYSNRDLQMTAD